MKQLIKEIFIPVVLCLAFLLLPSGQVQATDNYSIDSVHSMVVFRVKHLDVGYTYGRFNDPEGTFTLDTKNPENSSVEIKIMTRNVDTANEKRDQHLMSPDFFNAKQFPVIQFKSTKIRKVTDENFVVTGNLSLHGVTKTVDLTVSHTGFGKDPWGGYRAGFESTFNIKRSDYGMKFMMGPVADDVRITVSVEGIKQ